MFPCSLNVVRRVLLDCRHSGLRRHVLPSCTSVQRYASGLPRAWPPHVQLDHLNTNLTGLCRYSLNTGLMISCAASSIIASIFDVKHYLHLQVRPFGFYAAGFRTHIHSCLLCASNRSTKCRSARPTHLETPSGMPFQDQCSHSALGKGHFREIRTTDAYSGSLILVLAAPCPPHCVFEFQRAPGGRTTAL